MPGSGYFCTKITNDVLILQHLPSCSLNMLVLSMSTKLSGRLFHKFTVQGENFGEN